MSTNTDTTKGSRTGLLLMFTALGIVALVAYQQDWFQTSSSGYSVSSRGVSSNCQGSTLDTSCAQRTLTRWLKQGTVTVNGVQDVSAEGVAVAQVTLSDIPFQTNNILDNGSRVYSGPGQARFVHYNDGRWALMSVGFNAGGLTPFMWNDINAEFK